MATNIEDCIASLEKIKASIIENLISNTKKVCETIHSESQDRCPIDIGIMKERSGYYVENDGSQIHGYIGYLEFYAVYVHQGTGLFAIDGDGRQTLWWWFGSTEKWAGWHLTHGQKPKQFLWDAVVNNIDNIPAILAERT